jgi:hypothetical protein
MNWPRLASSTVARQIAEAKLGKYDYGPLEHLFNTDQLDRKITRLSATSED